MVGKKKQPESVALDILTLLAALKKFEDELQVQSWIHQGLQEQVLNYLENHWRNLTVPQELLTRISQNYRELNAFLVENGFDPTVPEFDPKDGWAVVALIKKAVKWLHGDAKKVKITMSDQSKVNGFELPPDGVTVYTVDGYSNSKLLELYTDTGASLWIFVHPDENVARRDNGLAMVDLSFDLMSKHRRMAMRDNEWGMTQVQYAGARIPNVCLKTDPDISFMVGLRMELMKTSDAGSKFLEIIGANQQLLLEMDYRGAKVAAATVLVAFESMVVGQPFVVDSPFYLWWTEADSYVPYAAAFIDYDCMRDPDK